MPIAYRPACEPDLQQATELVALSINDLTERHGYGPQGVPRPPDFQSFSLTDDPGGLWVAEAEGRIVGFGFSWICGDLWFLAQLFISPEYQGHGIGQVLLQRTLEHAEKNNVENKALITFSFNRMSQGLYIRHGLFPRLPIYSFAAPRAALIERLQGTLVHARRLENGSADLKALARIDAIVLGVSREKHHKFLLGNSAVTGFALEHEGNGIGYVYISTDGHIGPLAVREPLALGPAFRTALALAVGTECDQVSALLPGVSDAALGIAVAYGMRITCPMVLMSAQDFGRWSQYLPRNPGFM